MKKYLLVIVALEEELKEIRKNIVIEREENFNFKKIYIGKYHNIDIIVSLSGIGKVNASILTSYILTKYDIAFCLSLGIAGGINCTINDFIICNRAYYGDFDLTHFGYKFSEVPGYGIFSTNNFMIEKVTDILINKKISFQIGACLSFDKFITKEEEITLDYENIKCVEMESTAILHTCITFNINCLIIRVISDVIGKTSKEDYDTFEKKSSVVLNDFLSDFTKNIDLVDKNC